VSPVDGEAAIGVNAPVAARFSEPVNPATVHAGTVRISTAGGGRLPCSFFFEAGNLIVLVVPNQPLEPSTLHTLTLDAGITDLAGQRLGADMVTAFMTTATVDVRPAFADVTSPVNGATNVPTNAAVRVRVTEPLSPVHVIAGSFSFNASGVGAVAGDVALSPDRRTITFTPAAPLPASRFHSFTVQVQVRDPSGNLFAGGSGASFGFTTGAASDGMAPAVVAPSPVDGDAGLPLNAVLVLELDEPVDRTSVDHETFDLEAAGADVGGTFTFGDNDRVVRFHPATFLDASTAHTLSLSGITDVAGNPLAAASVDFTTGATLDLISPRAVSVSPVHGATNVPVGTQVVVTYDEPLAPVRINSASLRLHENGIGDRAAAVVLSADRRTLTVTPAAPLLPNRGYTVVGTGLLSDPAGNDAIGFSTSFTTAP
jgi:hypothetical protein